METGLKQFVEAIMKINPASIDVFGGGIPGMLGSSAAVHGAISPGADIVHSLKRQAAQFYAACQQADAAAIRREGHKLEQLLLAAEAVSLLTTKQAGQLLNQLQTIKGGVKNDQ